MSILNSMTTYFIRPEASVNDNFLKFVEFITPRIGQSCVVRLLIVINGQETLRTLSEALPIFKQRNVILSAAQNLIYITCICNVSVISDGMAETSYLRP